MSWWTEARDVATGTSARNAFEEGYENGNWGSGISNAWHSSPVTQQFLDAPWHLINNPKELAPSYVLSQDHATALDTAALGAPAESRTIRNTGRVGGGLAGMWGIGVAAGAGIGAGAEAEAGTPALSFTAEGEGGNAAYFGATPGAEMALPGEAALSAPEGLSGDPEMMGLTGYAAPSASSSFWPSLSTASKAVGFGSSAYGLYLADQARRERQRQLQRQREYQQRLDALMSNPSQVTSLPGYQFRMRQGEEAVARRMAAGGYGVRSGNLGVGLTKYGQDYATGELERQEGLLAQLFGMSGPSTNVRDPYEMAGRSLASLGYGVGRL